MLKDSVNAVVANLAPIKQDTEAAGRFANHLREPLLELTGRNEEGKLLEDKFILRNLARVIFQLTGRDEFGKVKEGGVDRLSAFLDAFFKKNYMYKDGSEMSRLTKIGESFLDYAGVNIWHRVFDVILYIVLWLAFVSPASKAIQEVRENSNQQLHDYISSTEKRLAPVLEKAAEADSKKDSGKK